MFPWRSLKISVETAILSRRVIMGLLAVQTVHSSSDSSILIIVSRSSRDHLAIPSTLHFHPTRFLLSENQHHDENGEHVGKCSNGGADRTDDHGPDPWLI